MPTKPYLGTGRSTSRFVSGGGGMTLVGGKEMAAKLNALDQDMRKKIGRNATRNAGKVVRNEIENSAPPRTDPRFGHIADEVKLRVSNELSTTHSWVYLAYIAHPSKVTGDAFYWYYLEFGTSKYAATPFVRPAFERSHREALGEMVTTLKRRLRRV